MSCLLVSGTVNINIHHTQAKTTHKITHKKKAKKKSYCYLYEIETPSIKSISLKKNTLTISGKFERKQGTSYKLFNPKNYDDMPSDNDTDLGGINFVFTPTKNYLKKYKGVLKYKLAKKCPSYSARSSSDENIFKISNKTAVSALKSCAKNMKKVKDKENDYPDYLHACIIVDHNKITNLTIDNGFI